MNKLKIGDFAKLLGVTPDFIKHYESYGLLESTTSDSGYRHYAFMDAIILFECFKYKRWGLSIKEMHDILHTTSPTDYLDSLEPKVDVIKKAMARDEMILVDHQQNRVRFIQNLNQWYIREKMPSYYIPHTINQEILDYPNLNKAIEESIEGFPITKECAYVAVDKNGNLSQEEAWGFFIPELCFNNFYMTPNENNQRILDCRFFEMNVCFDISPENGPHALHDHLMQIKSIMDQHQLIPIDYFTVQVHFDILEKDTHHQYCVVRVPIQ